MGGDALGNAYRNEQMMPSYPDSKVHGDNMGPIWGRQDPDGSHVSPMNLAIWIVMLIGIWLHMCHHVSSLIHSKSILSLLSYTPAH